MFNFLLVLYIRLLRASLELQMTVVVSLAPRQFGRGVVGEYYWQNSLISTVTTLIVYFHLKGK